MASLPPTPRQVFGAGPFDRAPELLLQPTPQMGMPQPTVPAAPFSSLVDNAPEPEPESESAIDKLSPGSELHDETRTKLDAMLQASEHAMKNHYDRWNFMESKIQAYVGDQDYEKLLRSIKDTKGQMPPEPVQVVVPYTYATMHSAATFMSSVLMGRKPVFPLMGVRGTSADRARYMEQALQQNLDYSSGQEMLWQLIWDALCYSFGCVRIGWADKTGPAIRLRGRERVMVEETTFAGNELTSVDPYKCFPDPRVPLHQCPDRGDFLFTMMEVSENTLKDMENPEGSFRWIKQALAQTFGKPRNSEGQQSNRRLRIGSYDNSMLISDNITGFREVFEGTVRLIPKDWKLGKSDKSELWKFTWFRGGQIIQAEPTGMLHGKHPYALTEPSSLGYEFMSLSQAEMISVFQDIISWLVSSRMENVRSAINNSFVADPARVEMNDIRTTSLGRVIRLKQSAMGLPINDAIKQLAVTDVTGGHLQDINIMRVLADSATGVNDNMRGIQQGSGRRSATEARMTIQAGASRLSQLAVRVSAQAFQPMARQMIFNIQQFMPDSMWLEISGDEGEQVSADMLVGDFNYQVSDGTLPLDKQALQEVWKEILFGIARDPELRQRYDLGGIFEHVAELGGAKDISRFKKAPPPPQIAGPGVDPEGQPVGAAVPSMPNNPF